MPGLIIYVILSASGLLLIKTGVNQGMTVQIGKSGCSVELNYVLILGMFIYVISFLMSLLVMKSMKLNLFYPVSAGAIYVIVCILSAVVLKESISMKQIIGMAVILVGIIIINLDKTG